PDRNALRVHVTKAYRPDWFSINDRVGFVDRNPHKIISAAIARKAEKLPEYRQAAADVRLLIVADRIRNSGKMELAEGSRFYFGGFQKVYLYLIPGDLVTLESS